MDAEYYRIAYLTEYPQTLRWEGMFPLPQEKALKIIRKLAENEIEQLEKHGLIRVMGGLEAKSFRDHREWESKALVAIELEDYDRSRIMRALRNLGFILK